MSIGPTPGASVAEKALLVGVALAGQDPLSAQASLDELARLAESAGAQVAGKILQQRRSLDRSDKASARPHRRNPLSDLESGGKGLAILDGIW